MKTVLIIAIFVFIIARRLKGKVKTNTVKPNPLYDWAITEGYGLQFGKDYIDHLSDMRINQVGQSPDDVLKEEITSAEFYDSDYQNCYRRAKKKDKFNIIIEDGVKIFETDIGKYRLKSEFKGVQLEFILSDEDIEDGKSYKKESRLYEDIDY